MNALMVSKHLYTATDGHHSQDTDLDSGPSQQANASTACLENSTILQHNEKQSLFYVYHKLLIDNHNQARLYY